VLHLHVAVLQHVLTEEQPLLAQLVVLARGHHKEDLGHPHAVEHVLTLSPLLLVFVALAFFDERDLRQHAHQRDRLLLLLLVKRLADRHARRQQVLDHLLAVVLAVAVHRVVFGGLILHVVEPVLEDLHEALELLLDAGEHGEDLAELR